MRCLKKSHSSDQPIKPEEHAHCRLSVLFAILFSLQHIHFSSSHLCSNMRNVQPKALLRVALWWNQSSLTCTKLQRWQRDKGCTWSLSQAARGLQEGGTHRVCPVLAAPRTREHWQRPLVDALAGVPHLVISTMTEPVVQCARLDSDQQGNWDLSLDSSPCSLQ